MRCFLAIEVPSSVREGLVTVQKGIEWRAAGFYSWSKPDQLHVTLYFMGEMEEVPLEEVRRELRKQREFGSFSMTVKDLVLLPDKNTPRIVAAGVGGDVESLTRLQRKVSDVVFSLATFKEERAFFPHLTLGRLKRGMPGYAKSVKSALADASVPPSTPFPVDSFALIQSTLTPQGSVYETIETFPLA